MLGARKDIQNMPGEIDVCGLRVTDQIMFVLGVDYILSSLTLISFHLRHLARIIISCLLNRIWDYIVCRNI